MSLNAHVSVIFIEGETDFVVVDNQSNMNYSINKHKY